MFQVVDPQLPDALHAHVAAQLDVLNGWGNNLPSVIPELRQVVQSEPVDHALKGLLHGNYFPLPHVAAHFSPPYGGPIGAHQDNLPCCIGLRPPDGPPTLAFALYYPTGAVPGAGATVVYRGRITAERPPDEEALAIPVTPGSVVVADFRLWHGREANSTDRSRWMVKFLFSSASQDPVAADKEPSLESLLADLGEDNETATAQKAALCLARMAHRISQPLAAVGPLAKALQHFDSYVAALSRCALERLGFVGFIPGFGPERQY